MIRYVKRRYADLRFAINVVAPVLSYSNFVLLAYNFSDMKDMLPFEIFVPLFTGGLVGILLIIGLTFRKKQLETDITLQYEQSIPAVRSMRILYDYLEQIGSKQHVSPNKEFKDFHAYMKQIEEKKV